MPCHDHATDGTSSNCWFQRPLDPALPIRLITASRLDRHRRCARAARHGVGRRSAQGGMRQGARSTSPRQVPAAEGSLPDARMESLRNAARIRWSLGRSGRCAAATCTSHRRGPAVVAAAQSGSAAGQRFRLSPRLISVLALPRSAGPLPLLRPPRHPRPAQHCRAPLQRCGAVSLQRCAPPAPWLGGCERGCGPRPIVASSRRMLVGDSSAFAGHSAPPLSSLRKKRRPSVRYLLRLLWQVRSTQMSYRHLAEGCMACWWLETGRHDLCG